MNENSNPDGLTEKIELFVEPPKKRGRGRPSKKAKFEAQLATSLSDGDIPIAIPNVKKGGNAKGRLRTETIPNGPYKTQSETWNALFMFQNINIERATIGVAQIRDVEIHKRTGLTPSAIEQILQSEEYKKFRVSKSASLVQQTIADIAPSLRISMTEFMSQLKNMVKCKECGRVTAVDMKRMHEGLQFVIYAMDKFGLPKIDTSLAENSDDMDTDRAVREACELIEETRSWPNFAPQRIVNLLTEYQPERKTGSADGSSGTLESGEEHRSDEIIYSVPVPNAIATVSQEVPDNHNIEPGRENEPVSGGLHAVRSGETPDSEDAEERSIMDFSGEER